MASALPPRRIRVDGHEVQRIEGGWEAAASAPDAETDPAHLYTLDWVPARVPGTAASALAAAGHWSPGDERDFDAEDWWFRTRFEAPSAAAGEEVMLHLEGVATVCEVHLNGELVATSDSMFEPLAIDVGDRLRSENELTIRCRALGPLLRVRRRPRARWRTRVVADGNLRFFRTTMLGRAPGFAPSPAAVGPWRPVWLERRRGLAVDALSLRPTADGLRAQARLRALAGAQPRAAALELSGPTGLHSAALSVGDGLVEGELRLADAARWWPHTHGTPALYEARVVVDGGPTIAAGRVGFRSLVNRGDPTEDGIALELNGVPLFARGAVWTPVDPVGLAPGPQELRATLERAVAAGMNMLRLPGVGVYESAEFHDLCDELGILVWQDLMFANMDYPIADADFRAAVEREAERVIGALTARPSTAVVCGNSEVEQQAAMLGLDPALGRGELFGELLPRIVGDVAPYVPSAPSGGALPFRPGRGVANYYGVGAYRRPLTDARSAGVRFAAECLAFANVPDPAAVERIAPHPAIHDPRWKAGVPRDVGAGWDFEDVRDHYLALLFDVDPVALRSHDNDRYMELSRAVSGELMAEVFGEWRRAASPSGGGLVLWLRDLRPGAGWGVLDDRGEPKLAYRQLRRALAPVAIWTTDEGLGGIAVHVANDRPQPLRARLRVALYADLERRVDGAEAELELAPHTSETHDLEALLGRFADVSWAYRFGPPAQDAVVVTLEGPGGEPLSQAFRFPAGRPRTAEAPERVGLEAHAHPGPAVALRSRRLAYCVRLDVPGFDPLDDGFSLEPGIERVVPLIARGDATDPAGGHVGALNMRGHVRIASDS